MQECVQLEVEYLRNDVRGCINNVSTWMGDERVEKNLVTLLDDTLIHYDPLGSVVGPETRHFVGSAFKALGSNSYL